MDKKELLKSLIMMARIDGKVSIQELHQLAASATRLGIPRADVEAAFQESQGKEVNITLPSLPSERRELLQELAKVMVADGEMAPAEKGLLRALGKAMSFSDSDVNAIMGSVL